MTEEPTLEYDAIQKRLYTILDNDPLRAIEEARALSPCGLMKQEDVDEINACILIDGGLELREASLICEGIELLRKIKLSGHFSTTLDYNLANGLSSLAKCSPWGPHWHNSTADIRRDARIHYEVTTNSDISPIVKGKALTNQGNLLSQSYRWVEAYEAYRAALQQDPTNAVASSGAVNSLLWAADNGFGSRDILKSVAAHYYKHTKSNIDQLEKHAGSNAKKIVDSLPETLEAEIEWPLDLSKSDEYTRFVANNDLALSMTIEGLDPDLNRWDSLLIKSISEKLHTGHGVPAIFAMFNILKADFLSARWLIYTATHTQPPESGLYSDTLDYATYGINQSLLTLGMRSAIDILDRIAVATSDYLNLPGSPTSIYFWKRWHKTTNKGKELITPLEWLPEIREEINKGNTALIALAEIAEDIAEGGYLASKRALRHTLTHRFVVLHDIGSQPSRENPFVDHYNSTDFEKQTIATLRLVRSALIYFIQMIYIREARLKKDTDLTCSLEVPAHHWVRGER